MNPAEYWTVNQAAEALKVSERTIRRWCQSGKLTADKVAVVSGVEWLIVPEALEESSFPRGEESVVDTDIADVFHHALTPMESRLARLEGVIVDQLLAAVSEKLTTLSDENETLRTKLAEISTSNAELRAKLKEVLATIKKLEVELDEVSVVNKELRTALESQRLMNEELQNRLYAPWWQRMGGTLSREGNPRKVPNGKRN